MSASAIATSCPKCGTFKRSGRVSCCAPGGAWYKNCGDVGDRNVGHSWLEGVKVCERKFYLSSMYTRWSLDDNGYPLCRSCLSPMPQKHTTSCHNDGHWFGLSPMRYHQEVWQTQLLRSRRFLVRKLRGSWYSKTSLQVVRRHTGLQSTVAVQGSHRPGATRCTRRRRSLFR